MTSEGDLNNIVFSPSLDKQWEKDMRRKAISKGETT